MKNGKFEKKETKILKFEKRNENRKILKNK